MDVAGILLKVGRGDAEELEPRVDTGNVVARLLIGDAAEHLADRSCAAVENTQILPIVVAHRPKEGQGGDPRRILVIPGLALEQHALGMLANDIANTKRCFEISLYRLVDLGSPVLESTLGTIAM